MDYASDFDSQGAPVRRKRRGGVSFLIIAIGTVCLIAAWILTASNPYTELANRVVEVRTPPQHPEAGLEGPIGLLPDPEAESDDEAFREMIASLPSAPSGASRPDGIEGAAARPPGASPAARRTGGQQSQPDGAMTVPVEEFAGPPMPQETAGEVELTTAERRAIQRRLGMAGHDAGASDGVFGPNTRAAIKAFQESEGFPATGKLDEATLRALKEGTDAEYAAWAESRRSRSSRGDVQAAAAPGSGERYVPAAPGDCARGPDGNILESQGLGCDLRGIGDSIRGVFAGGADSDFNPTSGAQR